MLYIVAKSPALYFQYINKNGHQNPRVQHVRVQGKVPRQGLPLPGRHDGQDSDEYTEKPKLAARVSYRIRQVSGAPMCGVGLAGVTIVIALLYDDDILIHGWSDSVLKETWGFLVV